MAYTGGLLPPHLHLVHCPPLYPLESFLHHGVVTGRGICLPLDVGSAEVHVMDNVCLSTFGSLTLAFMKE